ncbi:MAG TPA: AraC family transcriptional regulator ligand-binding domain-containing protein [Nocardioidaceae bacterium]|nr:AraC family transcriptional regulator ligand-binding domain-containing protein [Nocardioidaceae bacterium]
MSDRTLPVNLVQATVAFALRQGWDVGAMLERVGFSPLLLAEGKARVTERQLVRLLRELWAETGDELLGVGSAPLPRGSFRLLLYAVLGGGDLGTALERQQGFIKAFPALPVDVVRGPQETSIVIRLGDPESDPDQLLALTGLMASHRVIAWGIRQRFPLLRVELPVAEVTHARTVEQLFGAPLVLGAAPAIVFASALLARPLMRTEQEIDEFVARAPRDLLTLPRYDVSTSDRVRRIIEPALRSGDWPSAEDAARRLSVSPQTLRRRLSDEGTSFREVSDEVRRDAAVVSLVAGKESVADLAARLGFSEPSAFTRAFRRWTGSTPGAYRSPDPRHD